MLKILASLRKFAIDAGIVVTVGLVAGSILSDVLGGAYAIGTITVPDGFGKQIQDKDGLALQLRAEVGRLLKEAQTGVAVKPNVSEAGEPNLTVAGTSIPLRYVAGLVRSLMHKPYSSISGQLSTLVGDRPLSCDSDPGYDATATGGPPVRLVLQLDDSATGPFFDCSGDYKSVLEQAARATLKKVDPFAAATLMTKAASEMGPDGVAVRQHALMLVRAALAEAEEREPLSWLQRWIPLWADEVARAHLTLGNIYLDLRQRDLAMGEFEEANAASEARTLKRRPSAEALDALSIIAINDVQWDLAAPKPGSFESARSLACHALAVHPGLDSAIYHLAQTRDFKSRFFFLANGRDTCRGAQNADDACDIYADLLKNHPSFAIAYFQQGVMMLQRLTSLRSDGMDGCAPLDDASRQKRAEALERFIDQSFAMTILADPHGSDYQVWLQWGILDFIRQEPSDHLAAMAEKDRIPFLDAAIGHYVHAIPMSGKDYYVWYRLGEALAARASLQSRLPAERTDDRGRVVVAFCQASRLADEPANRAMSLAQLMPLGHTADACPARPPDTFMSSVPLPALAPHWADADCRAIRRGAYPAAFPPARPVSATDSSRTSEATVDIPTLCPVDLRDRPP